MASRVPGQLNTHRPLLCVAAALLALAAPTPAAAFTTGQGADLVLGQPVFTTNTATASATGMSTPHGVAIDPTTGKVFVADTGNHRVLRFADVATLTNGAGAEAVLGQADFTSNLANRGGAVAADTVNSPYGVFVDSSGILWVGDSGNHRVLRFNSGSTVGNGASANVVLGQADFVTVVASAAINRMNAPVAVFVDTAGRLWVTEYANNRVIRFDNAASLANGASANGVLGQPDFVSNATSLTATGMVLPKQSFVDSAGALWVADHNACRVLRYDNAAAKADGAAADGVLGHGEHPVQRLGHHR